MLAAICHPIFIYSPIYPHLASLVCPLLLLGWLSPISIRTVDNHSTYYWYRVVWMVKVSRE